MCSAVDPRSPAGPDQLRLSILGDSFPLLWIFGPPGVGKSTVAWRLFNDLQRCGTIAAFVDIDQLGISYPERSNDPGRHHLKCANLAALIDTYRQSGAQCLIVSGVIDADRGISSCQAPGVDITWCRLRADRLQLTQRLHARGESQDDLDDVWREAELLDADDAGEVVVVDTTDLGLDEVVLKVQQHTAGWLGVASASAPTHVTARQVAPHDDNVSAGKVLWLCGPTGVGKSAVGFNIFLHQLNSGSSTAFVDLDQVGFFAPGASESPRHQVKATNLAAVWHNFAVCGATHMVIVGPASSAADVETYLRALPAATVTVARLHADPDVLAGRIQLRSKGQGWAQPGDPILGRSTDELLAIARVARLDGEALTAAGVGDVTVDTTTMSVEQVTEAVLAESGWPNAAARVTESEDSGPSNSTSVDTAMLHLDPLAYVIGLQGVALMRAFAGEHDAAFVEERLAEITHLLQDRDSLGQPAVVPPLTPDEGYDAWSTTYDAPGNGLFAPDLARVTSMLAGHPGGVALDIACGTGRYAEWLHHRDYEVIGVDASPGMLAVAREKLPEVDFRIGDFNALPVQSGFADLAVCALALTHVQNLAEPYRELSRVLKPGGRLVVSDTHSLFLTSKRYPLITELPNGSFGYLPGWDHSLADHINAALEAGFTVDRVEELKIADSIDAALEPEDLRRRAVPNPWRLMTQVTVAANAAYTESPRALYLLLHKRSG